MENQQHIAQLFQKYLKNACSPEEAKEFLHLMRSAEHRAYFQYLIDNQLHADHGPDAATAAALQRVFSKLNLEHGADQKSLKTRKIHRAIAAAAILVVSLSVGLFYWRFQATDEIAAMHQTVPQDVLPGGNKATLRLANGQTVDLSPEQAGIVAGDEVTYFDGTSVLASKNPEGRLSDTGKGSPSTEDYVLSTPKGGTYRIELPDGTQVWLNAASTLTYPSRFDDHERIVFLEGEAYFDVNVRQAPNGGKPASATVPFKVVSANQTVEVFGTQFNVAAYTDEPETRTTLVEGHVRVTDGRSPVTLLPGQQAQVGAHGIRVIQANVGSAIDWKNGDFLFDDEDLKSIMRKVARWYDIDVVYEGAIRDETYGGQISRQKNLSEILRILQLSGGIRFTIEHKTVYIKP